MPTGLVGDPKTKLDEAAIRSITRPHSSLLTLLAFPFVFLPLLFKYHTLRCTFDDEEISAAWGILFEREIHLTYRRIQDIHVIGNLVERWLGIENAHEVRDTTTGVGDAPVLC